MWFGNQGQNHCSEGREDYPWRKSLSPWKKWKGNIRYRDSLTKHRRSVTEHKRNVHDRMTNECKKCDYKLKYCCSLLDHVKAVFQILHNHRFIVLLIIESLCVPVNPVWLMEFWRKRAYASLVSRGSMWNSATSQKPFGMVDPESIEGLIISVG